MATLNAYFDESGKKSDHPVVTFSGVCIAQDDSAQFNTHWGDLLRRCGIASLHMARASRLSEKHGENMRRGQTADERMDALLPFADCINNWMQLGLIQAYDVRGFNALTAKAKRPIGNPSDPYFLAFARGLLELHDYFSPDDRVCLICD